MMGKRNLLPVTDDSSDDDCMIVGEVHLTNSSPQKICKLEPVEGTVKRSEKRSVLFKEDDVRQAASRVLYSSFCSETVTKAPIKNPVRNVNYTNYGVEFHLERQQYVAALRVLEQSVSLMRLPEAKFLHAVLFKVSNIEDFDVRSLLCSVMSAVLAAHPPRDEGLRDYYFSTMSRKFKDNDTSSHWQLLHELLEVISSSADDNVQLGEEILIDFYLSTLERDLEGYSASSELSPIRVFWPDPNTSVGHFNFRCSELLQYHLKSISDQNWKLLNFTRRLFNILNTVVDLHERSSNIRQLRRPGCTCLMSWCQSLFTAAYSEGGTVDWIFFVETFASTEVRLLLSAFLSQRLGMVSEIPERLTAQLLFQRFLKWEANSLEFLKNFQLLKPAARKCFLLFVNSYMDVFHLREMFVLLRKMSAGKERKPPNTFDDSELFTRSYTYDDLIGDLCFLKYLSKQTASETCPLSLLVSM